MIHPLHIIIASILLLLVACSRKIEVNTTTNVLNIRADYDDYLRDNKDFFEFKSQKEFTSRLAGSNPLGLRYLILEAYPHKDGLIIDEWGTPLRITRPEKTTLEIRSASKDGVFDTQDDIVALHPRAPGALK